MGIHRRGFLLGLAAGIAAPAIVRPGILMPVRKIVPPSGLDVALVGFQHADHLLAAAAGGAFFDTIAEAATAIRPGGTVYVANRHFEPDAGAELKWGEAKRLILENCCMGFAPAEPIFKLSLQH